MSLKTLISELFFYSKLISFSTRSQENGCLRSDFSDSLTVGSKARFGSISDLAAGPDSVLYLADQERHQVKAVLLAGHLPALTPQAWINEL
jgi:hypothetical protein